jgi:hypothetical protein
MGLLYVDGYQPNTARRPTPPCLGAGRLQRTPQEQRGR